LTSNAHQWTRWLFLADLVYFNFAQVTFIPRVAQSSNDLLFLFIQYSFFSALSKEKAYSQKTISHRQY